MLQLVVFLSYIVTFVSLQLVVYIEAAKNLDYFGSFFLIR